EGPGRQQGLHRTVVPRRPHRHLRVGPRAEGSAADHPRLAGQAGAARLTAAQRLLCVLGAVWTAPNTVLGLFAGAIAIAAGASVHWRTQELAFVFSRVPWGPGGAITLGNVILYTGEELASPCWT